MKLKINKLMIAMIGSSLILFNGNTSVSAESKNLNDAKAKVSHLKKSLHNNYLGIKNQGQWEEYIKGIRYTVSMVPLSEKSEANKILEEVTKAEKLVKGLSRINQVEKSMEVNTHRIGNVRQWNNYLLLGRQDLSKVDTVEFSKEIDELTKRLNQCNNIVQSIESDFKKKFDEIRSLIYEAEKSKNKDIAWKAYNLSKSLSTCEESSMIEYRAKLLLADLGEVKLSDDEIILRKAYVNFISLIDKGFNTTSTDIDTIQKIIKDKLGNTVEVRATRAFTNVDLGEEVFDIVLYKGEYKLYPISVVFK